MAGPALPKWSPGSVGPSAGGDPFAGMYGSAPEQNSSEMDQAQFDALRAPAPPSSMDDQFAAIQQNEDAELQANLAAADARLAEEAARRPPGPGEVLAGQMQGSMGAFGDAAELYARNLPKTASRYNAAFPFVQQKAEERRDQSPMEAARDYERMNPFQPEPFQPLPRYEGESEEDYQGRMQIFADADLRSQMDAYERQRDEYIAGNRDLASMDTRAIGREPGAIGMEEAQRQGQENVDAAMEARDKELATQQAIAAGKQAEATTAVVQQQEEQRAREEAGLQAVQQIQGVRNQAREALAAMPQRSREQIAKGLSQGTKLAAVFGAIAQGWRGDAITAVNDAIDRGVAEEMDRYERRKGELGDVIAQADDTMSMLDFITNSVGGNREASAAMLREMRMQDAIEDLKTAEMKAGANVNAQMYKQMRVALEQQLRDETMAMELQAAKTPEYVGVRIDTPLMKFQRELAKGQIEDARKEQMDIRKEGRGLAIKDYERAADADVAMQLEGVKSQGAVAAKRAEKDAEWEQTVKKQTAAMGAVETSIDDFLKKNPGNIHGRGWVLTGESDQRIETDSFLTALQQQVTQAFTGATATEEQAAAFEKLVQGDWTELSDDALRARLRALKGIVANQREYLQRPLPSAESAVTNPRELSTFKPR